MNKKLINKIKEAVNCLDVIAETEVKNLDPEVYAAMYQASIQIRNALFKQGHLKLYVEIDLTKSDY